MYKRWTGETQVSGVGQGGGVGRESLQTTRQGWHRKGEWEGRRTESGRLLTSVVLRKSQQGQQGALRQRLSITGKPCNGVVAMEWPSPVLPLLLCPVPGWKPSRWNVTVHLKVWQLGHQSAKLHTAGSLEWGAEWVHNLRGCHTVHEQRTSRFLLTYSFVHSFLILEKIEMFEKVITEQCHESWVPRGLFQLSSLGPAASGSYFCLSDYIELYYQESTVKVPRSFRVRFWSHTDLFLFSSLPLGHFCKDLCTLL